MTNLALIDARIIARSGDDLAASGSVRAMVLAAVCLGGRASAAE